MPNLINPIFFQAEQPVQPQEEKTEVSVGNLGIDLSFFTGDQAKISLDGEPISTSTTKRKKRQTKKLSNGDEMVPANTDDLPEHQTNQPYAQSYDETNDLLKGSIVQIDIMSNDIKEQLDQIKASKTLKKKYDYIAELTSTAGTLIGTKITAIREMNKTITDCHNLELRRSRELNLGDQDSDKVLMDLYDKFINTPASAYAPLGPSSSDLTMMGNNIVRADVGSTNVDAGYDNYLNNLTPGQIRMRMENDPNIQTVVVFNQLTGERHFDVINRSTGESVPAISRPDPFLLENLSINVNTGMARDVNLDISYPLMIIGGNGAITEY